MGCGFSPGGGIYGAQCSRHGGDGFHSRSNSERPSGAHSAFNSTSTLTEALNSGAFVDDLVVSFRTSATGGRKTIAHLDTLNGLDSHQCAG
jgi:hypothetical protein